MKQIHNLVGMKYCGAEAIVSTMRDGTELVVSRQPDNPKDRLALIVHEAGGARLGFLKAGPAQQDLARAMDVRGVPRLTGRFAVTAERWPQVEIDF